MDKIRFLTNEPSFTQLEDHLFQCDFCGAKVESGIIKISSHWFYCTGKKYEPWPIDPNAPKITASMHFHNLLRNSVNGWHLNGDFEPMMNFVADFNMEAIVKAKQALKGE